MKALRHSSTFLLVCAAVLLSSRAIGAVPQQSQVVLLHVQDTIQPISEQYISRGIARAADIHAEAVLIELDTPGGLLDSTRNVVHDILASPSPVIVYVAPSGSRAGSAGFFILESADIAAMAPGTNAGAAHPVVMGTSVDPVMKQKLENDATAFLRSYVSRRNRNTDAAQDAVLNSKSYTEREAEQLKLIDVIAPSNTALLDAIDGRVVTRFDGSTTTLHTRNAHIVPVDTTLRENILDKLMDPNLAVLILVVGGLLIYLEFNTPGTIIPGALGTLLVVLALFALNLLPVRYTSLMLLLAAFALMILEAKFASHGVLAVAGIICLVFGTLTLVAGPIPELRVSIATAVGTGIAFGAITTFLVRIAIRARRNKVLTGPEALIGSIAIAQQPLDPRGQVMVHGELWFAESPAPVSPGEHVRVRAVRNLTLLVERVPNGQSTAI
ncbi:nodulation protein NfeD [Alloacidobacterium dinghuense]|uniref:Nodulation protein NfeD n=1 Tax=Alloacidobacterium dinghuense TaxID=2763107 RepID=A0A7G8BCY0_9BACT|nr:nodulation protein NfeD [Alloacidobacterium dinghuense]QNI30400.1 nodulation protein NfeD [Alloacidobacterium dinghuense]